MLPISTKNMLEESRVLTFIQRWAQTKTLPHPAEMDGYSSENTSRAQTPLNTPDGSSTKLGPELEGDASKPAVYRRLKIISENSLDSALSDASKASDGKEEEEEDDDEEEDGSTRAGLLEGKELKADPDGEDADPTKQIMEEPVAEVKEETHGEGMSSGTQSQAQTEKSEDNMELDLEKQDIEAKEDIIECLSEEHEESKEATEKHESGTEPTVQAATEKAELANDQPIIENVESESQSIQAENESVQTESESIQTDVSDLPPELPAENAEAQSETQDAGKTSPDSEVQPGESTTDAPPSSETPEATIRSEVTAVPVDPSVIGTPSQDEEEGVSDVESERSQEPQLSALDISGMAARLLESWKDLKVSSHTVP